MATLVGTLHGTLVHTRRVRILADRLAAMVPPGARVLDVGCGDGALDQLIMQLRPDVSIEGIDVLVRPSSRIHVKRFDGAEIPYPDASFDAVVFVDVLHHTANPVQLLREAKRVGKIILIKDHCKEGFLACPTLRMMDWVGNAHHGVSLPYNYWSRAQWTATFEKLGLKVTAINERVGLYPAPVSWALERGLHFAARIDRADGA